MKSLAPWSLALLAMPVFAQAPPAPGNAAPATATTRAWPPRYVLDGGTELTATSNLAWDTTTFSGDDDGYGTAATRLDDAHGWRRREFGIGLKKKGVFELGVGFDFDARVWQDVALRVDSKAVLGHDAGRFRIGQAKLPLGFEGNTSTRNASFMENSSATQAFYQGRRIGVDWAFERSRYLLNAGYYGQDLQGNNPGNTVVGRAAWTPRKAEGDVLHLGVSASREDPDGEINGLGVAIPSSVRWRAKPEASLTTARLVDSGTLTDVAHIRRSGVEALWIHGPLSLQGEYMRQTTERGSGLADYSADGYYLFGSWLVTGGTRGYSAGNVSNPAQADGLGALELLLRYSSIDLDHDGIAGGRQNNWTIGANWYPLTHVKLQANYVHVDATRGPARAEPHVLELRAQFSF